MSSWTSWKAVAAIMKAARKTKASAKVKLSKKSKAVVTTRIRVTLEMNIPQGWVIGETADWIEAKLNQGKWNVQCEVGEQRLALSESKKIDAVLDNLEKK